MQQVTINNNKTVGTVSIPLVYIVNQCGDFTDLYASNSDMLIAKPLLICMYVCVSCKTCKDTHSYRGPMTCFAQMGQFSISSSKASGVSASAIVKPLKLAGNVPGLMHVSSQVSTVRKAAHNL